MSFYPKSLNLDYHLIKLNLLLFSSQMGLSLPPSTRQDVLLLPVLNANFFNTLLKANSLLFPLVIIHLAYTTNYYLNNWIFQHYYKSYGLLLANDHYCVVWISSTKHKGLYRKIHRVLIKYQINYFLEIQLLKNLKGLLINYARTLGDQYQYDKQCLWYKNFSIWHQSMYAVAP
jgi:hypothetical protein